MCIEMMDQGLLCDQPARRQYLGSMSVYFAEGGVIVRGKRDETSNDQGKRGRRIESTQDWAKLVLVPRHACPGCHCLFFCVPCGRGRVVSGREDKLAGKAT